MKLSSLFLISLLNFSSPSFAMLDDPFQDTKQCWGNAKDLRPKAPDRRLQDPRYAGRSAIYGSLYPKMVMAHTYHHSMKNTPFAAALPQAHASKLLEDYCAQHLPHHKKIYSFVVQNIEEDDFNIALKPHYLVHPDAPTIFAGKDYKTALRWTVVPGAQGYIEPRGGSLQTVGLLSDEIETHRNNLPDGEMLVSGDSMHLNGFNLAMVQDEGAVYPYIPSKDMYSLVTFEDRGEKVAAITYHWLLNGAAMPGDNDVYRFYQVIDKTHTFRGLINGLEPLDSFKDLLGEFKKYVGFTAKQQDVADTYRSIKKSGNTASDEDIIKYVLKAKGCTDWDALSPAAWAQSRAEFISKAELREVEGLLSQQNYSHIYRTLKDSGNNASDEELVSYLLTSNGYTKWNQLTPADKRDIVDRVILRTEMRKLESLLNTVGEAYHSIKKLGNTASNEAIIKYVLESKIGYKSWDKLTLANKTGFVTQVVSKSESSTAATIELKNHLATILGHYRSIKAAGNTLPDEAVIKYILEDKLGYQNWDKLLAADKAQFITQVRSL